MKTKVTVVLNKTKTGRPQLFVEVANKTVEAENSPNKRWELNVPKEDPVSDSEFKLILQQLGLDDKFLPKTGHKVICEADAFYNEFDNGTKRHYLIVQICKDVKRLFTFDRFQEIGIRDGAKFHFEFEKKIKETEIVSLEIPKPEDKPAKPENKK